MRTFCLYYRDVKTLNVFMSKSDLLKLGDFGISRVLESESKFAESVSLLIFLKPIADLTQFICFRYDIACNIKKKTKRNLLVPGCNLLSRFVVSQLTKNASTEKCLLIIRYRYIILN